MSTADPGPDRFVPPPDSRREDRPWPVLSWPVAPDTRLEGRSVTVAPLVPAADAPALYAALDDDRVWRHLAGRPPTPAAFAVDLTARGELAGWQQWLVTRGGEVVGMTSYLDVVPGDARLEIGMTAYAPRVWGTTVNPEVKLLLLEHAFDTLGAGRVQLKTDIRNTRSQQAIARLGARHEGVLRRYQRRDDGNVRDTVLFAVTAEDWPDVRRGLVDRLAVVDRLAGG